MDKKYPDTAEGARACLEENSTYELADCRFTPDPAGQGVWAVDWKDGTRVVVYLAGWPDAWGRTRERNDFEEGTWRR